MDIGYLFGSSCSGRAAGGGACHLCDLSYCIIPAALGSALALDVFLFLFPFSPALVPLVLENPRPSMAQGLPACSRRPSFAEQLVSAQFLVTNATTVRPGPTSNPAWSAPWRCNLLMVPLSLF